MQSLFARPCPSAPRVVSSADDITRPMPAIDNFPSFPSLPCFVHNAFLPSFAPRCPLVFEKWSCPRPAAALLRVRSRPPRWACPVRRRVRGPRCATPWLFRAQNLPTPSMAVRQSMCGGLSTGRSRFEGPSRRNGGPLWAQSLSAEEHSRQDHPAPGYRRREGGSSVLDGTTKGGGNRKSSGYGSRGPGPISAPCAAPPPPANDLPGPRFGSPQSAPDHPHVLRHGA